MAFVTGRREGGKCDRFWSPSKEIKLNSQKTSKGWYIATIKGLSHVARNEPESCVSGLIRSTGTMYMTLGEVQQILRMTRIIYDFQTSGRFSSLFHMLPFYEGTKLLNSALKMRFVSHHRIPQAGEMKILQHERSERPTSRHI